jgi:hypothetical protein
METFRNAIKGLVVLVVICAALSAITNRSNYSTASAPGEPLSLWPPGATEPGGAPGSASALPGCQIIEDAFGKHADGSFMQSGCYALRQEALNAANGNKGDAAETCLIATMRLRLIRQHGGAHISPEVLDSLMKQIPTNVLDNILKGCFMLVYDISEREYELVKQRISRTK